MAAAWAWALPGAEVSARGDFGDLKPIPVLVLLGDKDNHLKFFPDTVRFETGKLYKLLLADPSPVKHEFESDELSNSVFTLKAEVVSPQGAEPIAGASRQALGAVRRSWARFARSR